MKTEVARSEETSLMPNRSALTGSEWMAGRKLWPEATARPVLPSEKTPLILQVPNASHRHLKRSNEIGQLYAARAIIAEL